MEAVLMWIILILMIVFSYNVTMKAIYERKKLKRSSQVISTYNILSVPEGITSISVSPKRYVELLKAEEELVDLKVKLNELKD